MDTTGKPQLGGVSSLTGLGGQSTAVDVGTPAGGTSAASAPTDVVGGTPVAGGTPISAGTPTVVGTPAVGTSNRGESGESGGAPVITAEIPAVPLARSYGVLMPDGTVWYPESKRRLPAPWPLRALVWVLVFVELLLLAGAAVEHYHPSWLFGVRNLEHATAPGATTGHNGGSGSTSTNGGGSPTGPAAVNSPNGGFNVVAPLTSTGVSYAVPHTYTIIVTASQPAWTVVQSTTTGANIFAQTIQGGTTARINATGTTTFQVSATGTNVTVVSGGKTIGVIATPQLGPPFTYTFSASGT
jgi:hypothetical protein